MPLLFWNVTSALRSAQAVALVFIFSWISVSLGLLRALRAWPRRWTRQAGPGLMVAVDWSVVSDPRAVGGYAAYVPGIPFSQAWIETTLNGPGTLTFYTAGNLGMGSPTEAQFSFSVTGVTGFNLFPWWGSSYSESVVQVPVGQYKARWQFMPGTSGITVYLDNVSFIPAVFAPTITTASPLPPGTAGSAYSVTLTATGGSAPYRWSIALGSLPAGLTLNNDGAIRGTPAMATNASFTVQVMGSDGLASQPRHLAWALFLRPLAITSTARQLTPTNGSPCNWDPRGCSCKPTGISRNLGEDPALWAWAATYGSYTQSWELTLELNLGNVILSQDGSQLRVGVSLGARDSLQVSSEAPANLLELGLGLRRIAGQTYRAFGARMYTNNTVAARVSP